MMKSTMSVAEMRQLLGLGKTDSYWLCHQGFFETVLVNGKMRVVINSFEDWYSMQTKHRKVTGEEPGARLHEETFSVKEIANMLGICKDSVLSLIKRAGLPVFRVHRQFQVPKVAFEEWYASQTHYIKKQERAVALKGDFISLPQMSRKLGITRHDVYRILRSEDEQGLLETVRVGDHCYVEVGSFKRWLDSQAQYHLLQAPVRKTNIQLRKPQNSAYYTVEEICRFYGYRRTELYRKLRQGDIRAIQIGNHWRIKREEFDKMITRE